MDDISIIKNLADNLDGAMALEINVQSEAGKNILNTLPDSNVLVIVSPIKDISPDKNSSTNISSVDDAETSSPSRTDTQNKTNVTNRNSHNSFLTIREQQVLKRITEGMNNKEIARTLGISHSTVKVHVKNILFKINKQSRLQAAVWAMDKNI